MNEDNLSAIVARVRAGEGLEDILASMDLNSEIATDWLKKHPTAKFQISQAKLLGNAARQQNLNT